MTAAHLPAGLGAIAEPVDGMLPEALSLREEEIRELRAAVRSLTPDQQEALALRYGAGLSAEEAARAMGRQAGTIRGLTFRAIASLRRRLTGEGGAGTGGDLQPAPRADVSQVHAGAGDFVYEPSKQDLLDHLVPLAVQNSIFKCSLESIASELGARMSAMDSATKNAGEMISKLTLKYNRARQAAITTELTEIVSGAESLKG